MTERQNAEITIKRRNGNSVEIIATVPITGDCTRRFYLMTEDYIRLKFSLAEPVTFAIGDYIEDELFGTFYMTDKQFPTFNETSGCYIYELQFDAYYMVWKNRLAMLTTTASGTRIRKETNWILTDTLDKHAQEICNNLSVLGFTYRGSAYSYIVENTATHAQEAATISYDGVDIISALGAIAEAFKCEWWVRGSVIHFGKCETDTASPFTFSLTPYDGNEANMVAVTPQRNDATYANRLYVFGGTKNIPETYGKKLEFSVTESATYNSEALFRDTTRKVTPDMFVIPGLNEQFSVGATPSYDSDGLKATFISPIFYIPRSGKYTASALENTVNFTVAPVGTVRPGQSLSAQWEARAFVAISQSGQPDILVKDIATYSGIVEYSDTMAAEVSERVAVQLRGMSDDLSIANRWGYVVCVEITCDQANTISAVTLGDTNVLYMEPKSVYVNGTLTYNGSSYAIRLNPYSQDSDGDYYTYFEFVNGQGAATAAPSGFGVGSKYAIAFSNSTTEGLDVTKVPISFWSTDYADPSSILKIGEARLHLPTSDYPDGFIEAGSAQDNDDTVEKVVLFDNIYPQCILKIADITETERKDTTENSDQSKTYWNWTQYSLTATQENGAAFDFKKNYIQGGVTLQARFLTPSEAGRSSSAGAGYKLAGMTFDVNFDTRNGNPTYTLVRNDNYGAKLPNETLRPTVGDPFVLLGWNVAALSSLGLTDTAEQNLATIGEAYKTAIEEDNFIFRCRMFSDSMYALETMPDFGRSIVLKYAITGDKVTRVLGYTFRLDRPWNTPEYEIGETDAYSRIRQLEEQMKAGNVSVSNTIVENVSSSSNGSSEIDLSNYLTVTEADQLYQRKGSGSADWSNITGKPTTLGGYGITDAYTKTEVDAVNFFERYTADNGQTYSIRLKPAYTGLWTDGFLSAGGINSNGGGGGGGTVTQVAAQGANGISVSGSPITGSGTLTIGVSSGYKLPTTSEWSAKADATSLSVVATTGSYNDLDDLPTIPTVAQSIGQSTTLVMSQKAVTDALAGLTPSFTESDPLFSASAAAGITSSDISNWNSKTSNVGTITGITMNGVSKGTSGVVNLGTVITSLDGYVQDGQMEAYVDGVLADFQPKVSALGSTTRPVYVSTDGTFSQASTYAGGTRVTLNGSSKGASTASFYAPATSGTSGQYLVSQGGSNAPVWVTPGGIASGNTALVTGGTVYSALQSYLTTSAASSTYLPLTGGTLTGSLALSSGHLTLPRAGRLRLDAGGDAYIVRGSDTDYGMYISAGHEADGTTRAKVYFEASAFMPGQANTDFGANWLPWGNIYAKRWYPDPANAPSAYIEWDSVNGAFKINGPVYSTGQVAAGGIISNN